MVDTEFLNTNTFSIGLPEQSPEILLTPNIGVIGVGGAGGNAVNNMIASHLVGATFIVANTDAQVMSKSLTHERIQLGTVLTQGLGAGSNPEIGLQAAEESSQKIKESIEGLHMLFIAAGMGGGTGTGASPVIARIAKEMGILTVGVVTKPFRLEGAKRMRAAEAGIDELSRYVDTLIVIPNQNLFRVAGMSTSFMDAFKMADDILYQGVRSITDLMMTPMLVNLDFADLKTVIREMGKSMMGSGEAEGQGRALIAAEKAISNPLLDVSLKGAKGILINISGGSDLTLIEVDEAAERIREEVDVDANIIFGASCDESLEGKIRVSVVATGLKSDAYQSSIETRTSNCEPLMVTPPIINEMKDFKPINIIKTNEEIILNDSNEIISQSIEEVTVTHNQDEIVTQIVSLEETFIPEPAIIPSISIGFNEENIEKSVDFVPTKPDPTSTTTTQSVVKKRKPFWGDSILPGLFGDKSDKKETTSNGFANIDEEVLDIPSFLRRRND